jgi:ATP-dependent RNA/DNA helicase IGHMBP2
MITVGEEARRQIDRLRELLALEEQAARDKDRALFEGKSARTLEKDGVLARGLVLLEESPAILGRVRWTLGEDPARIGHLGLFDARPGSVVSVFEERREDDTRGVVVRADRKRLIVIFDEPPEIDRDGRVDLILQSDTVTIARLRQGLDRATRAEGPSARLIEILLGVRAPRPISDQELAFFDGSLNDDQREAARRAVLTDDIALVHGPFGTGKTTVLVEVVRQAVDRGERVLCLTASNAAVDHLAISLLERDPDLALTRTGNPARAHDRLEEHTLAAKIAAHPRRKVAKDVLDEAMESLRRAERRSSRGQGAWRERSEARREARALFQEARRLEREAAKDVLERATIIAGTLTGYESELPPDLRFDRLIVDEASQALTPAILLGALRADRAVLGGDHRQLPPTVISPRAHKEGLSRTVFETLMEGPHASEIGHMLTVQHRMHERLMRFPSEQFYDGRLVAHPDAASRSLADLGVREGSLSLPERPLDVIDTAGAGMEERADEESASRDNPGHSSIATRVVLSLIRSGLTPEKIGVITPYAAQVALLHEQLSEWTPLGVEIDTVDGFQGREKEAIVFDAVRSNAGGELGFLADHRRLNVAITRARRKLVIIADSATLATDRIWGALFDAAIEAGAHRSSFELPDSEDAS